MHFVWAGPTRGFGKLADTGHTRGPVSVQFFHSPTHRTAESIEAGELRRGVLPLQSRVYFRSEQGEWSTGRVVGTSGQQYDIALPNEKHAWFTEDRLEVRCLFARPHPAESLAERIAETQFLHDRRQDAVAAMVKARNATAGVAGLVSGSIDLFPHQVAAVRRVLLDSVQRYLLADEVGMGKTVEAGAIIRQCLLDDADASVTVLVPVHLRGQWLAELRDRFHILEFDGRVNIHTFDELGDVLAGKSEMLVIDEAHHLVGREPLESDAYQLLAARAHSSPRLLLLSATPVLGNEDATLGVLHLLQPDAYPIADRAAFAAKVAKRMEFGRLLLRLRPDAQPFPLRRAISDSAGAFPEDRIVQELSARVIEALDTQNPESVGEGVRALRFHIADNYRLHQRIIRNRRSNNSDHFLPRKGKAYIQTWTSRGLDELMLAIGEWRDAITLAAYSSGAERKPEERLRAAGRAFLRLLGAVSSSQDDVEDALADVSAELDWWGNETERASGVIAAAARFPRHAQLNATAELILKIRRSLAVPRGTPARIVVFASSSRLAQQLCSHLGRGTLLASANLSAEELRDVYDHFRMHTLSDVVLVSDRAGEEGANLQFAHAVVHADLPFDPARLEQRIGRVDRVGRTSPQIVQGFVLPEPRSAEDDYWSAWVEYLCDGLRVIHESISDVQFVLEGLLDEVARTLIEQGPDELRDLADLVQERLAEERQRLEEQYALDELSADEGHTQTLSTLDAWEQNIDIFAAGIRSWSDQGLQVRWQDAGRPDLSRLAFSDRTLIPTPWATAFRPGLDRPVTFNRRLAQLLPVASLLRPGHPFIDALERLTRWEDRGTAFATERLVPGLDEAWLGFKLYFVVEADRTYIESTLPPDLVQAAIRRADLHLPPFGTTLFLDYELKEVTNPALLAVLRRPYNPSRGDLNLAGKARERWNDLVDAVSFRRIVGELAIRGESLVRAGVDFAEAATARAAIALSELEARQERTRTRQRALLGEHSPIDPSSDRDLKVNQVISQAVAKPSVWLDSIGFIALSPEGAAS